MLKKITHGEYKDVLFSRKCLMYSVNRIQSKNRIKGTYEINKKFLCLALMINAYPKQWI